MHIGVFDLFKVGVGPSSSHTMGPMAACSRFLDELAGAIDRVVRVEVVLYGSLSATGRGHATDQACLAGLSGLKVDQVTPELLSAAVMAARNGELSLGGHHRIDFCADTDLVFSAEFLEAHPNGMTITALDAAGAAVHQGTYFSIGGGFVKTADEFDQAEVSTTDAPYEFNSAATLLSLCQRHGFSISKLMLENEKAERTSSEITAGINTLWHAMRECIHAGMDNQGVLPGGLNVKRRAPSLYRQLKSGQRSNMISLSFNGMDWVNVYALAVNEENAAGGRMVTAPTNGAAGIVPAVLMWVAEQGDGLSDNDIRDFFLAAAAIGSLCKKNASISGAEVGCQGEVGSACAMAAAGLCEILGGTPEQVENAAEIGLEHNLGLTCDPIGGLVQVPCIERNAIAAVKAINAAQMALSGDGKHHVSLDKVIRTMRDTGKDMQAKYKETSTGGLAVNAVEC
ncbi:L-serine ammonia-lyase [Litorivicinus lipolyticus]|uniref:L-serine dehydratase n=1 Tax=Litorivicinus lipolyticus TaxID=418701 RepID=A0A5Q2QAY4_9GAMM|nr:L-serine ammonia-lyase [Litorivicinus lipolyticus]QGG80423.1 L-serine ammonia-lyase [Litorivicinus lipolyticus]